jgi:hypothetical protein
MHFSLALAALLAAPSYTSARLGLDHNSKRKNAITGERPSRKLSSGEPFKVSKPPTIHPVPKHKSSSATAATLSSVLYRASQDPLDTTEENKIVGGVVADPDEFPFHVDFGGCGGALVHGDIVVTAAHCAIVETNEVYINSFQSPHEGGALEEDSETRQIVSRRVYPGYDFDAFDGDIMVLKLDSPSNQPTVAINSDPNEPTIGEDLIIIGHGVTTEGAFAGSTDLRKVTVPTVSHAECVEAYDDYFIDIFEDSMLCAGFQEGGMDSCQGDSGGPALEVRDGEYVLAGVVSFAIGCGAPGIPGVNTRVSGFAPWIREQICALSDNPPSDCPTVGADVVPVRMDMTLDTFPYEVVWTISQNGNPLYKYIGSSSGLTSETVHLTAGEEYTFTIEDSASDGICCDYGNGNYTIVAELGSGDVVLVESDGDYGSGETHQLVIPSDSSSTPEPTASPSTDNGPEDRACEDSSSTFLVDAAEGERDCAFLANNLDRFSYLCNFIDVGSACPLTCDLCSLFS